MLSDRLRGASRYALSPGYYGIVEMGTLKRGATELALPTMPWRNDQKLDGTNNGNIPNMDTNMTGYTIEDTSATAANVLKWHMFVDQKKYIYICDRVLVVNCSYNHLNVAGLITGRHFTIDGVNYWCRSLTGGTESRNGEGLTTENYYIGGRIPNEWDRYVMNGMGISGFTGPIFDDAPAPETADWDTESNVAQDRYTAAHNQAWNWAWAYSWCSDTYQYADGTEAAGIRRCRRGNNTARDWRTDTASHTAVNRGWRPALVL